MKVNPYLESDSDYEVEIESDYINHDFDEIDEYSESDKSEYESDIEFE